MGTPRLAGTYRFAARARDTEARSLRWPVVLVVAPRLVVRTQRLPAAEVGRSYSANLTATGGVAPTAWKLRRGRLPHGIRLAPTLGGFTGTPREAGTHLVTVEVSDGLNAKSTSTFAIVIKTSPRKGTRRQSLLSRPAGTARGARRRDEERRAIVRRLDPRATWRLRGLRRAQVLAAPAILDAGQRGRHARATAAVGSTHGSEVETTAGHRARSAPSSSWRRPGEGLQAEVVSLLQGQGA